MALKEQLYGITSITSAGQAEASVTAVTTGGVETGVTAAAEPAGPCVVAAGVSLVDALAPRKAQFQHHLDAEVGHF